MSNNNENYISSILRQAKRKAQSTDSKNSKTIFDKITLNVNEQLLTSSFLKQKYNQSDTEEEHDSEKPGQNETQDPLYRKNNKPDDEEQLREKVQRTKKETE